MSQLNEFFRGTNPLGGKDLEILIKTIKKNSKKKSKLKGRK